MKIFLGLLLSLTIFSVDAVTLDGLIEEQCSDVPAWVVKKVITHESKTFYGDEPQAWPWTLNVQGQGYYFENRVSALAALERHLSKGVSNIDVGFGQVSWLYHHDKFGSDPSVALEPRSNIRVTCGILKQGYKKQSMNWVGAIAHYHRPAINSRAMEYVKNVLAM